MVNRADSTRLVAGGFDLPEVGWSLAGDQKNLGGRQKTGKAAV